VIFGDTRKSLLHTFAFLYHKKPSPKYFYFIICVTRFFCKRFEAKRIKIGV
jgi:hypothetical protein